MIGGRDEPVFYRILHPLGGSLIPLFDLRYYLLFQVEPETVFCLVGAVKEKRDQFRQLGEPPRLDQHFP